MLVREILLWEPFKFKASSKERGSARSQIAQNLNTYPGFTVSQRTVFVTLSIKETKSKSSVSFKLDVTGKCRGIESFIVKFEFITKFTKLARGSVVFFARFAWDGYSQSRPQPEAVLSPVSYRSSRRRRQRKRLLRHLIIINNTYGNNYFK